MLNWQLILRVSIVEFLCSGFASTILAPDFLSILFCSMEWSGPISVSNEWPLPGTRDGVRNLKKNYRSIKLMRMLLNILILNEVSTFFLSTLNSKTFTYVSNGLGIETSTQVYSVSKKKKKVIISNYWFFPFPFYMFIVVRLPNP